MFEYYTFTRWADEWFILARHTSSAYENRLEENFRFGVCFILKPNLLSFFSYLSCLALTILGLCLFTTFPRYLWFLNPLLKSLVSSLQDLLTSSDSSAYCCGHFLFHKDKVGVVISPILVNIKSKSFLITDTTKKKIPRTPCPAVVSQKFPRWRQAFISWLRVSI